MCVPTEKGAGELKSVSPSEQYQTEYVCLKLKQARRQARDELRLSTRRKPRLDTPTDRSRERAIKRIGDMGEAKRFKRFGR